MKKHIGLFFGSFNPIHTGHLILASHILESSDLKEVWFVISPQNPFKKEGSLLNEQHRLSLVKLAIEEEPRFKASNIEFKLPRPSYTVDTLLRLKDQYPDLTFTLIVGSDSYQNIPNWKNGKNILENYNIIIYNRPGFPVTALYSERHNAVTAPLLDISATHIRNNIRHRRSIKWLVPPVVEAEIIANQYYFSGLENHPE